MPGKYGTGFTLDFAYCKNCRFHFDTNRKQVFSLVADIANFAEGKHDEFSNDPPDWIKTDDLPLCKKRELVISHNRAAIEIAGGG